METQKDKKEMISKKEIILKIDESLLKVRELFKKITEIESSDNSVIKNCISKELSITNINEPIILKDTIDNYKKDLIIAKTIITKFDKLYSLKVINFIENLKNPKDKKVLEDKIDKFINEEQKDLSNSFLDDNYTSNHKKLENILEYLNGKFENCNPIEKDNLNFEGLFDKGVEQDLDRRITDSKNSFKIIEYRNKHREIYYAIEKDKEELSEVLKKAIEYSKEIKQIKDEVDSTEKEVLKDSKYFDNDYLKKYYEKDEEEINKELNNKSQDTLKLELKEAIRLSKKLHYKNEKLLFWKTFPFWAIFILLLLLGLVIISKPIITNKILEQDFSLSNSFDNNDVKENIKELQEIPYVNTSLEKIGDSIITDNLPLIELWNPQSSYHSIFFKNILEIDKINYNDFRKYRNDLFLTENAYSLLIKHLTDTNKPKLIPELQKKIESLRYVRNYIINRELKRDPYYKLGAFLYQSQLFFIFVVVSLVMFIVFTLFIIVRYVRKSGDDITDKNEEGHNKIKSSIETYLKPSVSVRVGLPDVISEAIKVLDNVKKEKEPFIIYYGAPALSGLENDEDLYDYEGMTDEKSNKVLKLLKNYAEIKTSVNHSDIEIKRFIKIILPEEFRKRSPKLQKRYNIWIDKQIQLLEEPSSKYKIFNATRAPRWGSSQSYIITNSSYLHIIGQGNACVHIKGKQIVELIKSKMADAIEKAQKEENRPQDFSKEALKNYKVKLTFKESDDFRQSLLQKIESARALIAEKGISIEHIEDHQLEMKKKVEEIDRTWRKQIIKQKEEKDYLDELLINEKLLKKLNYGQVKDIDPNNYSYTDFHIVDKLKEKGFKSLNIIEQFSDKLKKESPFSDKNIVKKLNDLGIISKKQLEVLKDKDEDIEKYKIYLYDLLKFNVEEIDSGEGKKESVINKIIEKICK